ncbi:MAG: hypothetical protein IT386_12875 [Deltaproteobacteria bacterium]|nr:hypothetical protein [Deltaproteobacteria bacterium]
MRPWIAALCLLVLPGLAHAVPDFSYSYGDPYLASSQTYIVSTSNAVLYSEGVVHTWKPSVGGTTFGSTTPGRITYHFSLPSPAAAISLWMNMPTFHWSYSQGHNFLFGSTDGTNWTQLADVLPPAFGSARDLGTVAIPGSLLGANDLWLRADLYSYGSFAPSGGVYTNTAQLSRWATNNPTAKSFRLEVTYVPEPATALLVLCGLGTLAGVARCAR